jgi:hypothetical protein
MGYSLTTEESLVDITVVLYTKEGAYDVEFYKSQTEIQIDGMGNVLSSFVGIGSLILLGIVEDEKILEAIVHAAIKNNEGFYEPK